jgi:hypothetical protein
MVRIHFPPAESPSLVPPQIRTIRAASMTPSSNSMRTSCAGRCHFGAGAAVQLDVYRSARHTMEPGAHLFGVGYDLPRCCSSSSCSPSGELTAPDRKRIGEVDRDRIVEHPLCPRWRHRPAVGTTVLVKPGCHSGVLLAETAWRNGDADANRKSPFGGRDQLARIARHSVPHSF